MTLEPRDYQVEQLADITRRFRAGHASVMAQMCTGAGKTGVAALWANQQRGRILFLCHTLSVIEQAPAEFRKWGLTAVPASGKLRWEQALRGNGIVIASTAATAAPRLLGKRGQPLAAFRDISAIIIDEAHHAADPVGKPTRPSQLVSGAKKLGIPVLGLTATPWRLSKKQGFNKTWDTLVTGPSWNDLRGEYLADVNMRVLASVSQVKGAGGWSGSDYSESQTLEANQRNPIFIRGAFDVLDQFARNRDGELRKTLVYAVGQQHAIKLARQAAKRGIPAGILISDKRLLQHARLPQSIETDRARVNERLRAGDLRLAINVNMVTEGYDLPDVECVHCLRPTQSLALWLQMCGRGSRLAPGKDTLLLIDMTDNHARLGDPLQERQWSLYPRGDAEAPPGDPILRSCQPPDPDMSGCGAMIHTSLRYCPSCHTPQGHHCRRCGKFRVWHLFFEPMTRGWREYQECKSCRLAAEERNRLMLTEDRRLGVDDSDETAWHPVRSIRQSKTKHNSTYYHVVTTTDLRANAFGNCSGFRLLGNALKLRSPRSVRVRIKKVNSKWSNVTEVEQAEAML